MGLLLEFEFTTSAFWGLSGSGCPFQSSPTRLQLHIMTYLMHFGEAPGIEQDSFCEGGLARINMSRDSNISDFFNIFEFL